MLVAGLSTWRTSSLLLYEDGPFDVFTHLRQMVGVYRPGERKRLARLFTCVWCLSVWVGAAHAVAIATTVCEPAYLWLAFPSSTVAILIDKRVRYGTP